MIPTFFFLMLSWYLCRYTNYGSQKAHDLSENSNAALLFYWNEMNRQVILPSANTSDYTIILFPSAARG
jgi:hypothetical protein